MKIAFEDLNSLEGLKSIDSKFLTFLKNENELLLQKLIKFRLSPYSVISSEYSEFIIELSPILDDFLAYLFNIEQENLSLKKFQKGFDLIYECRRKFVQRVAVKKYSANDIARIDFANISNSLKKLLGNITEQIFAKEVLLWLADQNLYETNLDIAAKYAAYMVYNNSKLGLFNIPRPIDPENHIRNYKVKQLESQQYLGFSYRDQEKCQSAAVLQAKYCIYCHHQQKDSCSNGIESQESKTGCPLKQKISEMNEVKAQGFNLATLAIIVIDNPLVAATGHRICNDCMKACIYQKQDPVNIPLVESNILDNVLSLPWGVEIYLLLTKWNPLNIFFPMPKTDTSYNVLVAGLGPAGFSLAHYLLNEGHRVIAIDGLKISPLHFDVNKPIKNWSDCVVDLSKKAPTGFGGVSEYGITNRWDKNNLTLVRLILERQNNFHLYGGIRLGSNLTVNQAFDMGFDHIALCLGAGAPKFLKNKNYFAKGVRSAADFLMNLQQGVAYLPDSNANLLIRLPAVVIGCGLTAIDSAVEILHYYPILVEKFLAAYENEPAMENNWHNDEREIAEEFIEHAKLFRSCVDSESKLRIIRDLGGVTICYRGDIKDSPAYRLNSEEIEHAIAIGVKFVSNMIPQDIIVDKSGCVTSVLFQNDVILAAKNVLIAIGTEKNEFLDIDFYNRSVGPFLKGDGMSHFGDCNQKYAGSVVKALASAKEGFSQISEEVSKFSPKYQGDFRSFVHLLNQSLISKIVKINILSDNIVEIVVHSPYAARNFQPGQFFRLQNFSANPKKIIEPLALTGSEVDLDQGYISLVILEVGTSSKLCRNLKVGEQVILMGPTGVPTSIPKEQKICLIGGGLGNAVLLPIAKALKEKDCQLIYFAGYRKSKDRFFQEKIESVSDIVVWCCDEELIAKNRSQDFSVKGNLIEALTDFKDKFGIFEQVICIGSDKMMQSIYKNKYQLFDNTKMIISVNSPMQCMMKGICGQCVQKIKSERGYIFSCSCQDQDASIVDFEVLDWRLGQNSLLEKLF